MVLSFKFNKRVFDLKAIVFNNDGAFALLILRYIATILAFLAGLVIARNLGAAASGSYYLFMSSLQLITLTVKFGQDKGLMKWVGQSLSASDTSFYIRKAMLISSTALAVVIFIGFLYLEDVLGLFFNSVNVSTASKLLLFLVVPFSALGLCCGMLRGKKRPHMATVLEGVLVRGITLLILLILIYSPYERVIASETEIVFYAYTAAVLFSGCLALYFLIRESSYPYTTAPKMTVINLLKESWPLFGISAVVFFTNWLASYMLAYYLSENAVGIYNICWRLVVLLSMVMMVYNSIYAPVFAKAHSQGNLKKLEVSARNTSKNCLLIAVVCYGLLAVFGRSVLTLFGEDFVSGYVALVVLSFGQFISMSCGSVGYLLMMTGNGKIQRNINIMTLLIMALSMPMLIHYFGIVGAAIATAVSISLNNLVAVYYTATRIGIQVFPFLQAKHS